MAEAGQDRPAVGGPGRLGGASARRLWWIVAGAVLVGLGARVPGVFWGANFPGGWRGHHPDEFTHLVNAELILAPGAEPRWTPHPYPKGLAGIVSAPIIALRALAGGDVFSDTPPSMPVLITAGRIVSMLFGVATVLLTFLTARRLLRDPLAAAAAAWFVALGGLHVTQSHFFLSDVPGLFALLLGLHLLLVDLQSDPSDGLEPFSWAAFAFGAAFGLKFFVAGLPSLAFLAVWRGPRVRRITHGALFFVAGIVIVNLGYFTPWDFYRSFVGGTSDPYRFSVLTSAVLYMLELPSILGWPLLIFGLAGVVGLGLRLRPIDASRRLQVLLVVAAPAAIHLLLVLFMADHFPRHLVTFIPWVAIAAGWALVRAGRILEERRGLSPAWVAVPVFVYMALFVFDGERVFIEDPRNEAAAWLVANVDPGTAVWWNRHRDALDYDHVVYPEQGRPDFVVIEMLDANHYLRGMQLNGMPTDADRIFDSRGQERVESLQGLFTGEAGYREVARFREGYFMPDYTVTDRLIGDRSRSYVTEVVIFQRNGASS